MREPLYVPIRPAIFLVDAQENPIVESTLVAPSLVVPSLAVDPQRVAYVCWRDREECRPVTGIVSCVEAASQWSYQCPGPSGLLFRFGDSARPWEWALRQRRTIAQPPPVETPAPVDPCAGRAVSRAWAAHVIAGPEFAMLGADPRLGFVIAPGFRRTIAADPYANRDGGDECAAREPSLDRVEHSRWLGTEFGFDFRGRVHWRFADPRGTHIHVGVAPIARLTLGRWRLPSILGALVPEVGVEMYSRPADPTGPMRGRNLTDYWLYLRPAGWSVGYLFARYPRLSVTLDVAPIFAIPLGAQRFEMSFSTFVAFEGSMW